MGKFGKEHVTKIFGLETFANKADAYVKAIKFGRS